MPNRLRWPQEYLRLYNEAVKNRCHEYLACKIIPNLKTGNRRGGRGGQGGKGDNMPDFHPTATRGRKTSRPQAETAETASEKWDSLKGILQKLVPKKREKNYIL